MNSSGTRSCTNIGNLPLCCSVFITSLPGLEATEDLGFFTFSLSGAGVAVVYTDRWECVRDISSSIKLRIMLGSHSVWSTNVKIGILKCSMCFARCTVNFFHVLQRVPQKRHGSSLGFLVVSWRQLLTRCATVPWSSFAVELALTRGSGCLCSRTRCCT